VFPKDILDFLLLDWTAFLVNQFAGILNVLAFSFIVGTNPPAATGIVWCTYVGNIFLQNETPRARPLPEVFDRG
jgi:hypothetical protein